MVRELRVFSKAEASFFYVFYLSFGGKRAVLIGLQNLSSPTPQPGIELGPLAVEAQSPNRRAARESPFLALSNRPSVSLSYKKPQVLRWCPEGIPHCQHSSMIVSVSWTGGT